MIDIKNVRCYPENPAPDSLPGAGVKVDLLLL